MLTTRPFLVPQSWKSRAIPLPTLRATQGLMFISVINQIDAQNCFTISLFHASTCFEHHVLIIKRSKLHYTASGIITPISSQLTHLKPTSQVVHLKRTLKVSILLCTILFHPSALKTLLRHVLETLLRHQSVSTITQFCLTVFPQKASRQLHVQKKILIHRSLYNNLTCF